MSANDVDTERLRQGNTQGTVSHESLVNGRPIHENQEDPEELTSGDFQSAAGGITGAISSVQQGTADAVNYVKSAIMPSSTDDATKDPEVKEFSQAVGETTESYTSDSGDGTGPHTSTTQSVSAGESEGGRPQQSYGDMARNTASAVQQKVAPRANAAPRDTEEQAGSWLNRTRYEAAETGEKAADKTSDWFAKQKGKAARDLPNQADEAADEARGVVRQAADSVSDGAQYVKERFTAAPTGNTNKDVKDEAKEAKGWFFSKKNKAKDEARDTADQTSSWLGGKKEQAKDEADHKASKASGWFGQKADEAEDAAEDSKDYLSRKSRGARDEADHQASKAKGWFSNKKEDAEDTAEDTKDYLSRKSSNARDEVNHQAGKAKGWFNRKSEEAQDAAEDTKEWAKDKTRGAREETEHQANRAKGWFGQKADEAEDAVEDSKDYLSRKSRGARDEADHQASKARGWFGQKADEAGDAAEDSKDYLSRKSRGARDEADHQAGKARGWFGQKADEAEDAAKDTKGYLSRKSSNARDEADHQAGKAKGWFGQKTNEAENAASRGSREAEHQGRSAGRWFSNKEDEAEDAAEDASSELGRAASQAKDKLASAGQYVQDRFTANPSGDNRRGRDLEDEAHDAKERTKGWFGSKKEQAEDTADNAKGFFGNRKEEAKDQASRTRGWFSDKADEAQQGDPSNDLGAAFREAKDSVKSGANYVKDRFTADVSGDNSGRRSSGRNSWDRDSGRDGRYLSDRVRDSLPDRRSVELRSREEYDYSNGMIPSNTATEMGKWGRR